MVVVIASTAIFYSTRRARRFQNLCSARGWPTARSSTRRHSTSFVLFVFITHACLYNNNRSLPTSFPLFGVLPAGVLLDGARLNGLSMLLALGALASSADSFVSICSSSSALSRRAPAAGPAPCASHPSPCSPPSAPRSPSGSPQRRVTLGRRRWSRIVAFADIGLPGGDGSTETLTLGGSFSTAADGSGHRRRRLLVGSSGRCCAARAFSRSASCARREGYRRAPLLPLSSPGAGVDEGAPAGAFAAGVEAGGGCRGEPGSFGDR